MAAMVAQAQEQGLALTGPDGLLKQLTKTVLETALNAELTEHLGHGKHADQPGREGTNVPRLIEIAVRWGCVHAAVTVRVCWVAFAALCRTTAYGLVTQSRLVTASLKCRVCSGSCATAVLRCRGRGDAGPGARSW